MEKDSLQTVPNILIRLAHLLGTEIKNGRLEIPERFGTGFCAGFVFNEHIRMMILRYELMEDIVVENPHTTGMRGRMILFKFQNILHCANATFAGRQIKDIPSVLIATSNMDAEAIIPIDSHPISINIEIDADYLNSQFQSKDKSPVLQSLLLNTQPLLFEQMIYPSLQKIIDEIVAQSTDKTFELFYLRIKAEELVCQLLMELEKRDEKQLYAINSRDIQAIYKVKEQMLKHLETPPLISELAVCAGMSSSKLKRLFKQIFGNSIFSYYQNFRMKEAARLLKEEKLSVSEVGYQMGFTNLSHFSKVFNEYLGMKPKQFSRLQRS